MEKVLPILVFLFAFTFLFATGTPPFEALRKQITRAKQPLFEALFHQETGIVRSKLAHDKEISETLGKVQAKSTEIVSSLKELTVQNAFLPSNAATDFAQLVSRLQPFKIAFFMDETRWLLDALLGEISQFDLPLRYPMQENMVTRVRKALRWTLNKIRGESDIEDNIAPISSVDKTKIFLALFTDLNKLLDKGNRQFNVLFKENAENVQLRHYSTLFWMGMVVEDMQHLAVNLYKYRDLPSANKKAVFFELYEKYILLDRSVRFLLGRSSQQQKGNYLEIRRILPHLEGKMMDTKFDGTLAKQVLSELTTLLVNFYREEDEMRKMIDSELEKENNFEDENCDQHCSNRLKLLKIHWDAPLLQRQKVFQMRTANDSWANEAFVLFFLAPDIGLLRDFEEDIKIRAVFDQQTILNSEKQRLDWMFNVMWHTANLHVALQKWHQMTEAADEKPRVLKLLRRGIAQMNSALKQVHIEGVQGKGGIDEWLAGVIAEFDRQHPTADSWMSPTMFEELTGRVPGHGDKRAEEEWKVLADAGRMLHICYQLARKEHGLREWGIRMV